MVMVPTSAIGPPTPTCTGCSAAHPALRQKLAPKLAAMACALRPTKMPSRTRPSSAAVLAKVKTFCTAAPVFTPKMLSTERKTTIRMAIRFWVFRPTSMLPSTMGPIGMRRHVGDVPDPVGGRDGREEDAEELAEGHADGGDGAGLDDQEERPAVEESPERAEGFAQVDVLAAGVRHHGGEFAVGERAGDGHESGDQPGGDQQRGRVGQRARFRRRR